MTGTVISMIIEVIALAIRYTVMLPAVDIFLSLTPGVRTDNAIGDTRQTDRFLPRTISLSKGDDGHWVTIHGSPVFIKNGESVGDAIKEHFAKLHAGTAPAVS